MLFPLKTNSLTSWYPSDDGISEQCQLPVALTIYQGLHGRTRRAVWIAPSCPTIPFSSGVCRHSRQTPSARKSSTRNIRITPDMTRGTVHYPNTAALDAGARSAAQPLESIDAYLNAIGEVPLVTAAEEVELAERM